MIQGCRLASTLWRINYLYLWVAFQVLADHAVRVFVRIDDMAGDLIDAVESSRFMTESQSKNLTEKLITLTSDTNAGKLKRNLHVPGRVTTTGGH